MARPTKQGLDYFALDVKMDDETELIEAEHGHLGFYVLIKMFQKIYSNGYYINWDEKQQLLFSKKVSVSRNEVTTIVNDCIKWDLFDNELYVSYGILTSRRIQEHYSKAIYKRVGVKMAYEYLLIDVSDSDYIEVTTVTDDRNPTTTDVSDSKSTQSKVEKSKEDKSRYLEFVFLKESEHERLVNEFGEETIESKIEDLDNYLGSTGKPNKYKDHNRTIRSWIKKDAQQNKSKKIDWEGL